MDALVDANFQWDGTRSDLAQQFYRAHAYHSSSKSTDSMPTSLSLTTEQLPAAIQSRVTALGLRFEQLPPLLQRALIWDSGFVFGLGSDLLQVYTTDSRPMAQLAVSLETFRQAGCSALNCTNEFRSQYCSGQQMLSVANCVTDDFVGTGPNTAMWATGSGRTSDPTQLVDAPVIPNMQLFEHHWVDGIKGTQYTVYAIHTVPEQHEPSWSKCPISNTSQATGLIVPCGIYRRQANQSKWQPPPASALVSKWLLLTQQEIQQSNRLSTGQLVLIVVGSVVVVVVIGLIAVWRHRRRMRRARMEGPTGAAALVADDGEHGAKQPHYDGDTFHSSTTPTTLRKSQQVRRSSAQFDTDTTNSAIRTLMTDPTLAGKRLNFDDLLFQRKISSGAFGEVWLADYHGGQVAVKRIRQDKRPKYKDLEDFTTEIRLTASLNHANLVQFVGVAWRSLDTVCMVTEYMANGDLQGYLSSHSDTLSSFWTSEKTGIALGVARALAYLHALCPPLIHRDVKAKNVLIDEELNPRLVDFGVSRLQQLDITMTSGIGTPFWTAPEVVEGVRYSESSDIYSFGVLLTELETCQLPYFDHQSRQDLQYDPKGERSSDVVVNGTPSTAKLTVTPGSRDGSANDTPLPASLRPFLILNLVMNGSLRPSLSPKCPEWLGELASACFQQDPAERPTAQSIAEILARQWSILSN